uniref:Protein kinase domain-containing protein n=1 Tax=Candidozyma auris TaxID=498019 RepID=A0A0L0P3G4_CANAR
MDILRLDIELDRSTNRKVVNLRFRLLQSIGQGQFGKVLLAEDITSKGREYVAIKTINRVDRAKLITKTYLSHTTKIKREIQIMKECAHPNVVKLYLVIDDLKFDKILLVLEYCKFGEIDWKKYNHYHEKYLKDGNKGITLNQIVRDVVNGLEYLHCYKHIIHRDLKPSNLLIGLDRTIKISDFGVSLILENNINDEKELGKTMGTPAFYAPELCQFVNKRLLMLNEEDMARSKVDARIDIWSLGVVIYCLFFHQLPFEGHNEFSLFKTIVNGELSFPKTRESTHVRVDDLKELELLKDLIKRLLSKDAASRPTLNDIKHHKFTTFELTKKEADKFYEYNRAVIAKHDPKAFDAFEEENRLTNRIKRLFGVGKEQGVSAPRLKDNDVKPQGKINITDLEKVDDLLDSYLDDSSSMGSLSEAEEDAAPAIDTTNLLSSFHSEKKLPSDTPTLHNSNSSHLSVLKLSRKSIPPPLKLQSSTFDMPQNSSLSSHSFLHAPPSPFSSGQKTPSTSGSNTVVIGESSPSSVKSIFSPSRRFFAKLKPTINSLYSPTNRDSSEAASYSDLAPPPFFGRASKRGSFLELISSMSSGGGGSRKNSMSSMRSTGLAKLSSSSSLLNLHGYLTDESLSSFSGKWQKAVERELQSDDDGDSQTDKHKAIVSDEDQESEVGDETLTMLPEKEGVGVAPIHGRNVDMMDQYLDRLEKN